MDCVSIMEALEGLTKANGINLTVLGPDMSWPSDIDYGFRAKLFPEFSYKRFLGHLRELAEPERLVHLEDNLFLNYTCFCLEGSQCKELEPWLSATGRKAKGDRLAIFLGPLLFQPLSSQDITEVMNKLQCPESMRQDFAEFYNRVPLVPAYDFWNLTIASFLSQLYGKPVSCYRIAQDDYPLQGPWEPPTEEYGEHRFAYKTIEERYNWEKSMLEAVARGDKEEAERCHERFVQFRLNPRTADLLRNQKNFAVILNTLLRKAAERGSVHPYHIDEISRRFAIQIETSLSKEHLTMLTKTMVQSYATLVKDYARNGLSPAVRNAVNYIDFNYAKPLKLEELAELFAVSPSHLSRTFSKEIGTGIVDYINQRRIKVSLELLRANNLSITDIASECGFTSSTYYSRIFHRLMGMTPMEYRNKLTHGES